MYFRKSRSDLRFYPSPHLVDWWTPWQDWRPMTGGHPGRQERDATVKVGDMGRRHALGTLIDDVKASNRWSDQHIADRAARAGYPVSKQNVARLRAEPVEAITLRNIRSLSAGLDVPATVVVRAMLAAMGVTDTTGAEWSAEQAIRRDAHLSARDKDMMLAMLAHLRGKAGEEHGQAGSAPISIGERRKRRADEDTGDPPDDVAAFDPEDNG